MNNTLVKSKVKDNGKVIKGMDRDMPIAAQGSHIPSIKKVIGKDEKQVTLEDVYNKLCGLEMAYSSILSFENFSSGGDFFSSASIGLSNIFVETLREMEEMIYSKDRNGILP